MKTIIVLPTYNESKNLPKLFETIFALNITGLCLCVVDDASPDGTGDIAEKLNAKYTGRVHVIHRKGKFGLGTAYIDGFKYALKQNADYVGQMDSDFSHPIDKIPEMINAMGQADIVIGSRYIEGGMLDANWSIWRKLLSRFGNEYAKTILRMPINDITGGFRLWHRYVLEEMPLAEIKSNGYAFQIETAYLAMKLGYRFKEIPIYFANRLWGKSKLDFRIQMEAVFQVWEMIYRYRNIEKVQRPLGK